MPPPHGVPADPVAESMLQISWVRSQWYDVQVVPGLLERDPNPLLTAIGSRRALVVTTPTVERLYGPVLRRLVGTAGDVTVHVMVSGEQAKTMTAALELCTAAQDAGLGRRDVVVAFGGGICCDVVTLAASLVRRGLAYIPVPTTLVGQIDAGIGLKGGVNFGGRKNYLGCFAPPETVLVDPQLLLTLPPAELSCGLAEMVKISLVRDGALFATLRRHGATFLRSGFAQPPRTAREAVTRAIALMLDELAANSYEDRTLRRLVDFGHTFSPLLEERSRHALRHGAAVALDMALSCELARGLGLLAPPDSTQILDLLAELGLPTWHPLLDPLAVREAFDAAMAHRGGSLHLVLPMSPGTATFVDDPAVLDPRLVTQALKRLREHAARVSSTRRPDVPAALPSRLPV